MSITSDSVTCIRLEPGCPLEEVVGNPPAEDKVDSCAIVACRLDFGRASRVITRCQVFKPRLELADDA
ncbi:hypothetical protein T492DRAFT_869443 [Pavlovales sp. CCMP2436]|nr:hypothetical protein T492DRAFT_869443 [Pavlovales sp. CCMP2436]